jgi:hypothetical protein
LSSASLQFLPLQPIPPSQYTLYSRQQDLTSDPLRMLPRVNHTTTSLSPNPTTGSRNLIFSFDPKDIDNDAPRLQLSFQVAKKGKESEFWYAMSHLGGDLTGMREG